MSRQLRGGPALAPPQSPPTPFVFGQANSANAYVRETRNAMREHRTVSRLVGVTEGYPDSVHDLLCDDECLSDASSTRDNYPAGAHTSPRMCALAATPREESPLVK